MSTLDLTGLDNNTDFYVYYVTYDSGTGTVSTYSGSTIYTPESAGAPNGASAADNQIIFQSGTNPTAVTAIKDPELGIPGTPSLHVEAVADDGTGFLVKTGSVYIYYSLVPFTSGTVNTTDNFTVCFLRGTLISTPNGDVPIENLNIGDMVLTHGSGPMPIAWIGRSAHTLAIGSHDRGRAPICISFGALGNNLPEKDLWVSPRHCMLVDGALIPAECLVNGVTITQPPVSGPVEYFQLELDKHECVRAAGTWSETFLDQGDRFRFHNAHEHDGVVRGSAVPFPMPIIENGTELARRIEPIHARAGLLGQAGPQLVGHVDRATAAHVSGWAFDTENPNLPIILDIVLGGEVIASAVACAYRKDIQQAGRGLGMAGFFADLPEGRVRPDDIARLQVVRRVDGQELAGVHKKVAVAA